VKAAPGRRERIARHPAAQAARRAWPVVLEAYRRWDRLSPEQKERYRRMASEYSERGQRALSRRRKR
jgi:hypothetical protein